MRLLELGKRTIDTLSLAGMMSENFLFLFCIQAYATNEASVSHVVQSCPSICGSAHLGPVGTGWGKVNARNQS